MFYYARRVYAQDRQKYCHKQEYCQFVIMKSPITISRLAKNLKLIRKVRWRLSQDGFSELMDSTRSKINSYENGGVEPSIAFVLKLQSYTKLSVKEIFYEELLKEQVPPEPLAEDHYYVGEPIPEPPQKVDLDLLLSNQNAIKEALEDIRTRIVGIENNLKEP